jgi:hypothetical protein
MSAYRQSLFEWNDSINCNLALIQQYFGDDMRNQFDYQVGRISVDLGAKIEAEWRDSRSPQEVVPEIRIQEGWMAG